MPDRSSHGRFEAIGQRVSMSRSKSAYLGWVGFIVLVIHMYNQSQSTTEQELTNDVRSADIEIHSTNINPQVQGSQKVQEKDDSHKPIMPKLGQDAPTIVATSLAAKDVIVIRPVTDFKIIVLTMNRVKSLTRLLTALEASKYGNDKITLEVKVDKSNDNGQVISLAQSFKWSHGPKFVDVATKNRGLRDSWFAAWKPQNDQEHAIIFEDDTEPSLEWYHWMKDAWANYGYRKDIAGISLQRQTLVPFGGMKTQEIVNDHQPFFYALLGSYGFSPDPRVWSSFLKWLDTVDRETVDVSTPGLITSSWFSALKRRGMWTQYFIWFNKKCGQYTLYLNLPDKKSLISHHQEKGEHYKKTLGRDFERATVVPHVFPTRPRKYGFDAKEISFNPVAISNAEAWLSQRVGLIAELTARAKGVRIEGHIFNIDAQGRFSRTPQLKAYIERISKSAKTTGRICEIGFNAGHSAALWASLVPFVEVLAFDMCIDSRCEIGQKFFNEKFTTASLKLIVGNSLNTVPKFSKDHPSTKCDVIVIDGGNTDQVPGLDLQNMKKLAHKDTLLLIDDADMKSNMLYLRTVGTAWDKAKKDGLVEQELCAPCYRANVPKRTTCNYCIGKYRI